VYQLIALALDVREVAAPEDASSMMLVLVPVRKDHEPPVAPLAPMPVML
jgi:hypothetical protein